MNVAIPPRPLNQLPAAWDTPTAERRLLAAQTLRDLTPEQPLHIAAQRRLLGDFIGDLPVNSVIHPAGLPIATSLDHVLRIRSERLDRGDAADEDDPKRSDRPPDRHGQTVDGSAPDGADVTSR